MIKPETTHNNKKCRGGNLPSEKTKERNDEQMQKLRAEKGITLIALVITIIVMLILVGVSVTVALNGGLFTTAKEAAEGTASKRNEELNLSDGKVTINGEEYNSIDEYVNGGSSNEPTEPENPTGYAAYTIGQEVTVGGENFYVIADSDETNPNVTLLAKYNLNREGTAQLNATASETACAFSSSNYWSGIEGITYPYNLNDTATSEDTDAIAKARTYGAAKGGTGKLMTKEEAETLATNHAGIIYGTSIDATDGYLFYWLGSTDYEEVLGVVGVGECVTFFNFYYDENVGVRPVVEISKSSIS